MKDPLFYRMFGYDRGLLPNPRLRELESSVTDMESALEHTGLTIGFPGWGLIYHLALCSLNPDRKPTVIETGTNQGCSSIVLAQAMLDRCQGGVLHTIEIDEAVAATARNNIELAGLSACVHQHVGASLDVLPGVLSQIEQVDLAFLDGSHAQVDAIGEFDLVLPKLTPGALVIFDNTYPIAEPGEDQRVYGALMEILERGDGQLVNLPFVSWYTPGVAIWQRAPFEQN